MEFLPEEINRYAEAFSAPEPEILARLNRETHAKVLQPRMLSGHIQGRLLAMVSHMMRPARILEIGTYTGYSALCLAEGLAENGLIHTIDRNDELEDMIRQYIEEAGYTGKIQLHIGVAADIIPTLKEEWDLVFIDADKENYGLYYDLCIDWLRPGGYILADNVLWSGKVTRPVEKKDEATRALKAFNEKLRDDERVEQLLLPVRDGLTFARKKQG